MFMSLTQWWCWQRDLKQLRELAEGPEMEELEAQVEMLQAEVDQLEEAHTTEVCAHRCELNCLV